MIFRTKRYPLIAPGGDLAEKEAAWDLYHMDMAHIVASKSKDPSTVVGAIIVDPFHTIVGTGYNGFPRGVLDTQERYNNRDIKYEIVVHAEVNAIITARKFPLTDCTMYSTMFPCSRCAAVIINSGIGCVIAPEKKEERWMENFKLSREILTEGGVYYEYYVT